MFTMSNNMYVKMDSTESRDNVTAMLTRWGYSVNGVGNQTISVDMDEFEEIHSLLVDCCYGVEAIG